MKNRLLPISLAVLLSACSSLAPSYRQPAAPVPQAWPVGAAYAPTTQGRATDIPWQDFVLDERLRQVIAQALANSRDLRKTVASIESARAQYRVQRAALLPTVAAGVSGTRARSATSSTNGGELATVRTQSTNAGVSVSSYELDLFGKVRSLSDAALETYLATEEVSRATRISLIAETTSAWLTLGADRSKLAIAQQTLESAQRSMALTQKRLEAGVTSRVDVRQAETVYQQARADLASTTTQIAQDRNALELLAGSPVADALLPAELPSTDGVVLADVPAGLSSQVLLGRPDVLQAEHQLKSANANIGAARAAFFPSLSLTASGGVASAALAGLFSGGAATVWSLAPSLSVPIFDGGANRASLAYSQAQQSLYLSSYELAVQTAFQEVSDALARRGTMAEQLAAQTALVDAAADSYRLADARYQKGVDTFLTALDSQRTLYTAQTTLVTTRLTALDNRVTLYRVLGGGVSG
ncbi:efflux transporter outer membrane subunit [Xylophilus rhododendri]|uniref:Efflux transporter outer membrane subunit n=1 Tax=Xylophilus rhododendri TaxID=2697032 RepID=A0A857JE02_9BURK|nr:efflux transporter outer membrane subunit [Xylophilus rhododendri]QHJ01009.1 efflux transporter outer membrane subunit [Xylophilus rhododendri]